MNIYILVLKRNSFFFHLSVSDCICLADLSDTCGCFFRWDWWQAGSPNKDKLAAGRAVWPRPGQLGYALLAGGALLHIWTRRTRGVRLPGLSGDHRHHVLLCGFTLGEIQHWHPLLALGLWHWTDCESPPFVFIWQCTVRENDNWKCCWLCCSLSWE